MATKQSDELCPYCGTRCYENGRGDIICPNHGIVLYAFEKEKRKKDGK